MAKDPCDNGGMSTVPEVVEAWKAIEHAEAHYREVLRAALPVRGAQTQLVAALGRSREQLRQDAMTDAEREAIRHADAERKRRLREAAAANE